MKKFVFTLVVCSFAGLAWAGTADSEMEKILDQYFKIQAALAQDSTNGIGAAAGEILAIAVAAKTSDQKTGQTLAEIRKTAQQIEGKKLDQARRHFDGLSKPIMQYFKESYSGNKKFYGYSCSMQKKSWLQPDETVRNPYYGSSMLSCGMAIE